jgi:thiamine biosynthesis lipoprotein
VRRVEQNWGTAIGVDVRDAHDGSELRVALDAVFEWFTRVDDLFSTWRDDTEIVRIGRGELAVRDAAPEVRAVLALCDRVHDETGGAFDVTVGARARVAPRPGLAPIDPSGLVKGWAVDEAAERLARAGARNFCINAGGDVVARGRPEPDRLWRVGIRHPVELERIAAVVAVEDLAVATSGEYERGAHILDPHTRRPPTGLLSVTIVGPDLATADAYATAAFAMGAEGPRWTATLTGYEALCITSDHAVLSTPGFAAHRA